MKTLSLIYVFLVFQFFPKESRGEVQNNFVLFPTNGSLANATFLSSDSTISTGLGAWRTLYVAASFEKNPDLEPLFSVDLAGGVPFVIAEKISLRLDAGTQIKRELNGVHIRAAFSAALDAKWIAFALGLERGQGFRLDEAPVSPEQNFWGTTGGLRFSPWKVWSLFVQLKSLWTDSSVTPVLNVSTEFAPFSTGFLFLKTVLEKGQLTFSGGWEQRISAISFRIEFQPEPMFVSAGVRIPLGPVSVGYGLRVSPSLGMFHRASLAILKGLDVSCTGKGLQ